MDEAATTNEARPETIIGSYRLIKSLGSGGMSSVYHAVHIETSHEVAFKILPRDLAKNQVMLQRFLREARNAEALEHPNIVTILDRGVDDGRHYLVMELVEGGDLQERVKTKGPLGIDEAVSVIRAVSVGLHFAAYRGLIHRDIKPANLLMTPNSQVKIIDLGLAVQSENEDERVTREGTTVGTVDYMSPEQARDSRATSFRSDIYSLGATFYFLLTGSPPFPDGNVSDKLNDHFSAPRPDVRKIRPEVPSALARLIQRMMAKSPERRFKDYVELIAALESVPTEPEDIGLVPLESDRNSGASSDSFNSPLDPVASKLRGDCRNVGGAVDQSFVETITLELSVARGSGAGLPGSSQMRITSGAAVRPEPLLEPELDLGGHDEEEEEPVEQLANPRHIDETDDSSSVSSRKLVLIYCSAGSVLVLFLLLSYFVSRPAKGRVMITPPDNPVVKAPIERPPEDRINKQEDSGSDTGASFRKQDEPEAPTFPKVESESELLNTETLLTTTEPEDPKPESFEEEKDWAEFVAKNAPTWPKEATSGPVPGSLITVRRVIDSKNASQKPTLVAALFEKTEGTVEVSDNGPFFEEDLRISGTSRMVRSRPGYRPIISVERSQKPVVLERPAVFWLQEGKSLILDGLDLVVDVGHLSTSRQSALFLCQGATLTLRNCTITVINSLGIPFTVFQSETSSSPTRIRLERTLIRGKPDLRPFRLGGGSVEVLMLGSALVGGRIPLFTCTRPDPGSDRRVHFLRSILVGSGPIIELDGPSAGGRPSPLDVRAFGSAFGRLKWPGRLRVSLISSREDASVGDLVRWTGDLNVFTGWSDWVSVGGNHTVKVLDPVAARRTWPRTDEGSKVSPECWAPLRAIDLITATDLKGQAPVFFETNVRVASPSPFLMEKTIRSFPGVVVPTVLEEVLATPTLRPGEVAPPIQPPLHPVVRPRVVRELIIDRATQPRVEDLGLFLNQKLLATDKRVRVKILTGGKFEFTPLRVPLRVSLEIIYDPPPPQVGPDGRLCQPEPPLIYAPTKPRSRSECQEALIDVNGGDLLISNVRFERDASAMLKALFHVSDGHLILDRCWLQAPGKVDPNGGRLVSFRATSTRPLTDTSGYFDDSPDQPVNRPICLLMKCLLITGGDAFTAEMGRGTIALSRCAIASGGTALGLFPAKVARKGLDVGLWLDHCTISAEKTFVLLGRWPGSYPGPNRPWLIDSRHCAYLSNFDQPRESVLLRVDPEALAHGTLFWQSHNDAFEVVNFTSCTDVTTTNPFPNIDKQWTELWGGTHVSNPVGPGPSRRGNAPSLKFVKPLRPGKVEPANLMLKSGRGEFGADLDLLQVR